MMAHVDLCSGIGGFSLGFSWSGLSKPVLFCEIDPWCRKVLAKHWPSVPIAEDVKELANDPNGLIPDCDILSCGYPCQPFSVAGKQRGAEDDRHIWPEIFKIIQAKRPTWIVCENVPGHISLGLNQVLSDLEDKAGYAVQTFCIGAVSVNAPHRRQRIFVIAHTNRQGESDVTRFTEKGQRLVGDTPDDGWHRGSTQAGRERAQDFTKQPQPSVRSKSSGPSTDVADTQRERQIQRKHEGRTRHKKRLSEGRGENVAEDWWAVESRICHLANGLPEGLDRFDGWEREPADIPRVATGVKDRVNRLKGLGNAILPQIAMRIGQTIKAVHDG